MKPLQRHSSLQMAKQNSVLTSNCLLGKNLTLSMLSRRHSTAKIKRQDNVKKWAARCAAHFFYFQNLGRPIAPLRWSPSTPHCFRVGLLDRYPLECYLDRRLQQTEYQVFGLQC